LPGAHIQMSCNSVISTVSLNAGYVKLCQETVQLFVGYVYDYDKIVSLHK
jgi:hypothetical protein